MEKTVFDTYIGLEIHIQLITDTKIFCSCRNSFGDPPNTNICPVCMGYPGVLPVLNKEAVRKSYIVCRALNFHLNEKAVFDRKNYFYPDLPKNYQITQFEYPFGINGYFENEVEGEIKKIRIHEAHLEEDAGKMIHEGLSSYCDYNRTGTPLLEIVTEPDFRTGEEVEAFLHNFRRFVRYLGVCDGNMEEGSMRCDANISINHPGKGLGRKVEIKNLNSSRNVKLALQYEEKRQWKMLKNNELIAQETRLWDDDRKRTESMRSKEDANDYRYFPEPDLPPYFPDKAFLETIEKAQVELPTARKNRFITEYKLSPDYAEFLTEERDRADFYESACSNGCESQAAASWLKGAAAKALNDRKKNINDTFLTVEKFAELLTLVSDNRINSQTGRKVLEIILDEDKSPEAVVKENSWEQLDNSDELEAFADRVLSENEKAVEQIKAGDMKPVGFLIGQVMKISGGKADPKKVKEIITGRIK